MRISFSRRSYFEVTAQLLFYFHKMSLTETIKGMLPFNFVIENNDEFPVVLFYNNFMMLR
jgi:hypothetical protein